MTQRIAVGCDVSMDTIDIHIKTNPPQQHKISNNENGYKQLLKHLTNPAHYHICMEATGNYHEDFADYLKASKYSISVVNPLKIKHYTYARFNRTKTDKQDSQLIAEYCEDHKPKPTYQTPTEQQYKIRRHISHINRLNKQQTALKNQIHSCKDSDIKQQLQEQLQLVKHQLKQSKTKLQELSTDDSTANIASIPSIGKSTAAVLAYYLNQYHFKTENQFTAFAGLAPQKCTSGKSVRKRDKTSHLGNRTLKNALYMNSVVAYRIGLYRGLVTRMKNKGKSNKQILVAIMRKLACLAFTLWQTNQPYRPKEMNVMRE